MSNNELLIGIIGAGGAICGSIVSVTWTELFNVRNRRRELRERLHIHSLSVLTKLQKIYSSSIYIHDHLKTSIAEAQLRKAPYLALFVPPYATVSEGVQFSIEERSAMVSVAGTDLLNKMADLDLRSNSVLDNMRRYTADHASLFSNLQPNDTKGTLVEKLLSRDEMMAITPRLIQLDSIIIGCLPILEELTVDTFEALRLLSGAKERPLGPKFAMELPDPTGRRVTLRANADPVKKWWSWAG